MRAEEPRARAPKKARRAPGQAARAEAAARPPTAHTNAGHRPGNLPDTRADYQCHSLFSGGLLRDRRARAFSSGLFCVLLFSLISCDLVGSKFVGLQPTVIASRAPHLLLEQSVMIQAKRKIQRIVDVHRPSSSKCTFIFIQF